MHILRRRPSLLYQISYEMHPSNSQEEEFEMCIVLLGGHKKTISLSTLPKCISMISFMTFLTCL